LKSKGKLYAVHEVLHDPRYNCIDDLKHFKVEQELSIIDNLVLKKSPGHHIHLNWFSGGDVIGPGGTYHQSDDRLKSQEACIVNAVETFAKLKPQAYMAKLFFDSDNTSESFQAGLVSQDIHYDCPELKQLVFVPLGATPSESKQISDDPAVDPDYSD
jgi:hypothetical protein